jgi:DNA-binding CsgD family transcriptional regulator
LRRLDRAETSAQVSGILGDEPSAAVAELVFRRSGGNPFLVEELLAGGHDLPASLRDILLLRVHQLPATAGLVVRAAALGGPAVEHVVLAEVLGLPAAELDAALEAAVRQYVLVPDGDRYAFRHALVAEALVADTLPGERMRLHRAFATALAAGPAASAVAVLAEVARHWHAAGDARRALAAAIDAGLAAQRAYALPEAYALFQRALELHRKTRDPSVDLVDLYQHAAQAAYAMGEAEAALALIEQGLHEATDPLRAGMLHRWQGRYMLGAGRPLSATLTAFENATRLVPDAPTRERAEVLAARASMIMLAARPADAVGLARDAIAVARLSGARAEEAHAVGTLGACLAMLDDTELGLIHLREALSISIEIDDKIAMWRTYVNLSAVLSNSGSLTEGSDVAEAGLEAFPADTLPREQYDALLGNVLESLFWLGRWDELTQRLNARGEQHPGEIPSLALWRAEAALRTARGDFARAAQLHDRCRAAHSGAHVEASVAIQASLAELQLWRGQPRAALVTARQGLGLLAGGKHSALTAWLLAVGSRACADLGAAGAADGSALTAGELAARIADLRRAGPASRLAQAHLANAEGELARMTGGDADNAWQRAACAWERLAAPFPQAYAGWRWAEALLRTPGQRRSAGRALVEAHAMADALDAGPLRDQIERLARRARLNLWPAAAGSSGEQPGPPDAFGLTQREQQVLVRIACGDTNRKIAKALFISEKTVGIHVSRILAKMQVPNRAAAAAIAHRSGLVEPQ